MVYSRPWCIIGMVYPRPWCIIAMVYDCHGVGCEIRRGVGRIDGIIRGEEQNQCKTSELALNRTLMGMIAK